MINRRLQLELARASLNLQKDEVCEFFAFVLGEANFETDLVVIDLFGLKVEICVILTDYCIFIRIGYLSRGSLTLGTYKPGRTCACDVFVI